MEREGLSSLFDLKQMSVMGFVEVVKHLKFFNTVKRAILAFIEKNPPDRVILIDFPGFNLRIAKKIKKKYQIPITYYISPQIWAWKSGRIRIIRQYIDQMLVIFPFEKEWYRSRGVQAKFVGHPMLDAWQPSKREDLCHHLDLDPGKPVLALFPGSRRMEIHNHLSLFIGAARTLKESIPPLQIILGAVPGFESMLPDGYSIPDFVILVTDHARLSLEVADTALVASGTSTVEAAIFNTPMVIIYKMRYISWLLTRLFVKVKFAGMVNILAGKKIVPEFLQSEADIENIYKEALKLLTDRDYSGQMVNDLKAVQKHLGGPGASQRSAEYIMMDMETQLA